MMQFSKYIATVMISDPALVQARCALSGMVAHEGSIFVECKELGFTGMDLIYCRFGLAVPYIRVQVGDTVLIEPTVGDDERWFYVGLADCAGRISPSSLDQLNISVDGLEITFKGMTRELKITVKSPDGTRQNTIVSDMAEDKISIDHFGGESIVMNNLGVEITDRSMNKITMGPDGITIYTVDSKQWCPNTRPVCLFTGAPHGGPLAGILRLKGS